VLLSNGSVLVMGGYDDIPFDRNDVWKTVDGGASWILVTSSAGWTGKKILHSSNSLPILPSLKEDARGPTSTATLGLVPPLADVRNPPFHEYLGPQIRDWRKLVFPFI
jgi:hypothetical protein